MWVATLDKQVHLRYNWFMKKIIHFSDLHGKLPEIPKKYHGTDVIIVLSGDICDNYPDYWTFGIKQGTLFTPSNDFDKNRGLWNYRRIDWAEEGRLQDEWIEARLIPYLIKCNINLANVVAINGNHDGCNFDKWFPNSLHTGAKTITVQGIKIGLLVGVPIFTTEWYEEIGPMEMESRIKSIEPDIDILISHTPPYSILDNGHGDEHIGSQELYVALFGRSVFDSQAPYFTNIKLNLFGHAHEGRGTKHFDFANRQLRCYNASNNRFELEL